MIPFIQPALFIFAMRVVDVSFSTLRLMMVVRGRKAIAWVFAFCQSMVFVNALRQVITDLSDWRIVLGYAAGFATGLVVGILIEGRLAIGFTHLRIASSGLGAGLSDRLREAGFAVTEVSARGKDGMITYLNCTVLRKQADQVARIVVDTDPQAFVTAEAVRAVRHGFWHK